MRRYGVLVARLTDEYRKAGAYASLAADAPAPCSRAATRVERRGRAAERSSRALPHAEEVLAVPAPPGRWLAIVVAVVLAENARPGLHRAGASELHQHRRRMRGDSCLLMNR